MCCTLYPVGNNPKNFSVLPFTTLYVQPFLQLRHGDSNARCQSNANSLVPCWSPKMMIGRRRTSEKAQVRTICLCSKEWSSSSPVKASQTRLFTAPQPFQQFSWLTCCLKTTNTNQSLLDLKFSQEAFSEHNYLRKFFWHVLQDWEIWNERQDSKLPSADWGIKWW